MTSTAEVVMLARVSGSLFVVLLVAVLAARLARRLGRRPGGGDGIAVRERVGLTRETSAVVLEVDGRLLLLGVAPHQVTLLAELGDPPAGPPRDGADAGAPAAVGALRLPAQRPATDDAARATTHPTTRAAAEPARPAAPLTRREIRAVGDRRRAAVPPIRRGTGSVLDPRTWQQGVEALRDLTARRG